MLLQLKEFHQLLEMLCTLVSHIVVVVVVVRLLELGELLELNLLLLLLQLHLELLNLDGLRGKVNWLCPVQCLQHGKESVALSGRRGRRGT